MLNNVEKESKVTVKGKKIENTLELSSSDKDTLREIEGLIYSSGSGRVYKEFVITPALAKAILDKWNNNNRKFKIDNIRRYAKLMKAGEWGLTGEPISFTTKFRLGNGQNRLSAGIMAGVPFKTDMCFRVEDELFKYIDTGAIRTGSDALKIAGYKNHKHLADVARWVELLSQEDIKVRARKKVYGDDIVKVVRDNPELQDYVLVAQNIYRNYRPMTIGVTAAFLFLTNKENREKSEALKNALLSGNLNEKFAAFNKLTRVLTTIKEGKSMRNSDVGLACAGAMIKAWNAYIKGQSGTLKDISYNLKDPFPRFD